MSQRTDRFCTALHALEESRDPGMMEPLLTDEPEFSRPELDHAHGPTHEVREFGTAFDAAFLEAVA